MHDGRDSVMEVHQIVAFEFAAPIAADGRMTLRVRMEGGICPSALACVRGRAPMIMPDYHGGSIVNLMASIVQALGAEERLYPPLRALPPARLTSRNIVLLVIDGLGHDSLITHCRDGVLARHMKDRITSVFPSTTATAITTFLTGTAAQQHGVTGWFMYFRELGGVLAVLPYQPRHGNPAPMAPARPSRGSCAPRVNATTSTRTGRS